MSNEVPIPPSIDVLLRRRLIVEVAQTIRSGKEATTWRCLAHPSTGRRFLALKAYRPLAQRAFRDDAIYRQGRHIRNGGMVRALAAKSDFGQQVAGALWVDAEFTTLQRLHAAGVPVPRPIARTEDLLLMEFLGEDGIPAPQLREVTLSHDGLRDCWQELRRAIAAMLASNRVHGDCSAYNILWHDGRPWLIDFPQAVDPRFCDAARSLLERDVVNVARWFTARGLVIDAIGLCHRLWQAWQAWQAGQPLDGDALEAGPA